MGMNPYTTTENRVKPYYLDILLKPTDLNKK
jgi:hypothetical protein